MAYKLLTPIEESNQKSSSTFIPEAYVPLSTQSNEYVEGLRKKLEEESIVFASEPAKKSVLQKIVGFFRADPKIEAEVMKKPEEEEYKGLFKETLSGLPQAARDVSKWLDNQIIEKPAKRLAGSKTAIPLPGGGSITFAKWFQETADGIEYARTDQKDPLGLEILETTKFGAQALSGLTGGLYTPQQAAPENVAQKFYKGFSEVIGIASSLKIIGSGMFALGTKSKTVTQFINVYPRLSKVVLPLLINTGAFTAYGQLNPELAGDFKARMKQMGTDALLSVPFTAAGFLRSAKISIPASVGLGFGLAKLSGATNEDAIIAGVVLGTLDAFGRTGGLGRHGFMEGKKAQEIMRNQASDVLGVNPNAKPDDITRAYRKKAFENHPDRGGDSKKMAEINAAYEYMTGESESFQKQAGTEIQKKQNEKSMAENGMELLEAPDRDLTFGVKPKAEVLTREQEHLKKVEEHNRRVEERGGSFIEGETDLPTDVRSQVEDADISPELQARAEEDWIDNYAEKYGEAADRLIVLEREIKDAKKADKVALLKEQTELISQQVAAEDTFVKKWSTDTKESSEGKIEELESKVVDVYNKAGTDPDTGFSMSEKVLSEIMVELELSRPGERWMNPQTGEWGGVPSSFPKWIPEDLRSADLFEKVFKNLDPNVLSYPEGNRPKQRALYNALLDEADLRLGVDTSADRKQILELYEKPKETKTSKADSGRAPRSEEREAGEEGAEKGVIKKEPTKELREEKSRFATAQDMLKEVGRPRGGKQGLDINRAEARQLVEYLTSLDDPKLTKERGIVYKPYGYKKGHPEFGKVDIILGDTGFEHGRLEGGKVVVEATKLADGTYKMSNHLRVHATPLRQSEIVDRLGAEEMKALASGKEQPVKSGSTKPQKENPFGEDKTFEKSLDKRETPSGEASAVYSSKDLPDFPVEMGGMEHIKPVQFPELVRLAKDLMGEYPKIVKQTGKAAGRFTGEGGGHIKLIAALFKEGNIKQASMTLAHEIGHLIDYLPEGTLSRGNIIGRLNTLSKFMKSTFGESEIKNSDVRKELLAVTRYWHPYDPENVPDHYKKYRESSKELYAEAVSVLFNSPGLLEKMAPKFYKEFFDNLDNKPEVKKQFFDLQDFLNMGEEAVLTKREQDIRNMFRKGEDLYKIKTAEHDQRKRSYMSTLRYEIIDRNEALIQLIEKTKKEGRHINDDENPIYYLEEHNYLGGKIKNFIETKIDPVYKKVQKAGATWEDFGVVLFLKRVMIERADLANPLGQTPETAARQLEDLSKKFSPETFKVLTESAEEFRDGIKEVMLEGYKTGLYKSELYQQMVENPAYATFQVLDYLQEYIPASIKKQVGTLKEISNPATATVIKTISTIRAIERNIIRKKGIEFLQKYHPTEVKPAKKIFDGKKQVPIESQEQGEELLTYMDKGLVEGVYVDEYIQKSFERNTVGQNNAIVRALRLMNSNVFRPLFITYNPGFQAFNLLRDFQRAWKSTPGMTLFNLVKLYGKSFNSAKARAFSHSDETIREMEKSGILSITYNDIVKGREEIDDQIDKLMTQYGLLEAPTANKNPVLKVVMPILDFIEKVGNLVETLPKVAGYKAMNGKLPPKELGSFIRTRIGSPDFLRRGAGYGWYNELFLFSNAIKEGMRGDYATAVKDPKTRSGYWWKTAKREFVPKLLMLAAAIGIFGDKVKEIMAGASEYDKTNYTLIPLGVDDNGKSIYIRIPSDETGRILGALLWKGANLPKDGVRFSDVAEIASYTGGQLPSFSPSLSAAFGTAQFMAGNNPYDFFRGRSVLSDSEFEAGGKYALIPFLKWQFQQLGGGTLMRFEIHEQTPTEKGVVQTALNAPVVSNVVGRFLKISDYGVTERNNKIRSEVEQERAVERIEENKVINKYIKEFQSAGSNQEDIDKYTGLATKEAFRGQVKTVRELKAFQKKFQTAVVRGESDPNVNALIYAETNDTRIALLTEYQKNMSKEEFADLFRFVQEQKIVGEDTAKKFINSSN